MKDFKITEYFTTVTGHKLGGEECLLVTLYRFHRPTSITDACFKNIFGLYYQQVSRMVNCLVNWLFLNWSYLLQDNMAYWFDKFPEFAEKIRLKVNEKGCSFNENDFNIFGFIDCTVVATSRPGGGPVSDGVGSRRNPSNIQRSFFNGWKHHHGVKLQTVYAMLCYVLSIFICYSKYIWCLGTFT
jgi:hypothetical protein